MYVCMYWYNNISEQNRCQSTTELDLGVDHELEVMIVALLSELLSKTNHWRETTTTELARQCLDT